MAVSVNFAGLQDANEGIARVKAKFEQEMTSLIQIVEETTQNDWKGPDATLFVNNTKEKITKMQNEYNDFLQKLCEAIMANHDKFKDVQQYNVNIQG